MSLLRETIDELTRKMLDNAIATIPPVREPGWIDAHQLAVVSGRTRRWASSWLKEKEISGEYESKLVYDTKAKTNLLVYRIKPK